MSFHFQFSFFSLLLLLSSLHYRNSLMTLTIVYIYTENTMTIDIILLWTLHSNTSRFDILLSEIFFFLFLLSFHLMLDCILMSLYILLLLSFSIHICTFCYLVFLFVLIAKNVVYLAKHSTEDFAIVQCYIYHIFLYIDCFWY